MDVDSSSSHSLLIKILFLPNHWKKEMKNQNHRQQIHIHSRVFSSERDRLEGTLLTRWMDDWFFREIWRRKLSCLLDLPPSSHLSTFFLFFEISFFGCFDLFIISFGFGCGLRILRQTNERRVWPLFFLPRQYSH